MVRTATCRLFVWLVAASLVAAAPAARVQQGAVPAADLLARYAADLRTPAGPHLAGVTIDLDVARADLNRLATDFTRKKAKADVTEHQRQLFVSFALELAQAGAFHQAGAAARLVEWACPLVRDHKPQSEFDRAWQLAALAVLEGGIDGRALADHLDHVKATLSAEPRVLLARGIAEEQDTAPAEAISATVNIGSSQMQAARTLADHERAVEHAIARFREALQDDSVRAEAGLRLGHVLLGQLKYDDALAAWASVEAETGDPALIYLVRLFRGLAFEGLGKPDDAKSAYQGALDVSPGAHAATMRLAALAFRNGRRDEAGRMLVTLLSDDDSRRDFWWSYYAADWRFWYARIARVHVLLAAGAAASSGGRE